ncbi:TonB-dependent hemoglobin/transferrin/lactoferrin family receptor [Acinetobacter sp. WZC-1]|uniref:TonB-dependent hemoglobin/transferrin/lactoferrin family receptor n=1 Tax=Acinetobacter sp. WZC-1 TaxID=3459034 RepID=UPI00403D8380
MSLLRVAYRKSHPALWVHALSLGAVLGMVPLYAAHAADDASSRGAASSYNIPGRELGYVLSAFATQAGITLSFDSALTRGLQSPGLRGSYTVEQGLQRLLQGTRLMAVKQGTSYTIRVRPQQETVRSAAAGGSAPAAPSGTQTEAHMAPIHVQATDKESWAFQQPRAVSVIDRSSIDNRPVLHLADILKDTPGVYSVVNRQDPALSINIRGMQDFGRVNMMIDGMRQNHVEVGHQQRNGQMYMDPEFISSVVIEKGPRNGVHGATAIAGSADFKTIDFSDVVMEGKDQGVRIRAGTGLGNKYDGNIRFQGSAAVAGNFGAEDQLQLLYAHAYNKQGATRVGEHNQSNVIWGIDRDPTINNTGRNISILNDSGRRQQSNLLKAKYHLSDIQSLQLSYIDTEFDYSNMSQQLNGGALYSGNLNNESLWKKNGDAHTKTESYALDYAYHPNDWVDLKAKLYYVDTQTDQLSWSPRTGIRSEEFWRDGICLDPSLRPRTSVQSILTTCAQGYDRQTKISTRTQGLQLDNTSHFKVGGVPGFSANYGLEYFRDKSKSPASGLSRDGVAYGVVEDSFDGSGQREMGSVFGSLNYDGDGHHLEAGLRYDYYRLKGDTTLRTEEMYWGLPPNNPNPSLIGWYTRPENTPVNLDKDWKKLLPSVAGSVNVVDGLDLFASWGRSWRPPAITETLLEGRHAGDSMSRMYPNPYLQPEHSESLELGFNINKQGLLTAQDKLNAKVSYYDTKVDNYTVTSMAVGVPGGQPGALGRSMYVQNQIATPFKGVELDLSYDAEVWYARLNYNHVIGGDNKFCLLNFPQGSGRPDDYAQITRSGATQPLLYQEYDEAAGRGYPNVRSYLDAQMNCAIGIDTMLNSARTMPTDKGTFVLGARLFDRRLDMGVRVNYSEKGGPRYDYNYGSRDDRKANGVLEVDSTKRPGSEVWKTSTTYDAYISYIVSKNLTLRGSVENIQDKSYLANYGDPLSLTYEPGRTFFGGMELRF